MKRSSILLIVMLLASCAVEATGKDPVDDDVIDPNDDKADSANKPTIVGAISWGSTTTGSLTASVGFHGYTFSSTGDSQLRLDLAVTDGKHDGYLLLYERRGTRWGRLDSNDDCTAATLDACLERSVHAGDYLVVATTYENMISSVHRPASYRLTLACRGGACGPATCVPASCPTASPSCSTTTGGLVYRTYTPACESATSCSPTGTPTDTPCAAPSPSCSAGSLTTSSPTCSATSGCGVATTTTTCAASAPTCVTGPSGEPTVRSYAPSCASATTCSPTGTVTDTVCPTPAQTCSGMSLVTYYPTCSAGTCSAVARSRSCDRSYCQSDGSIWRETGCASGVCTSGLVTRCPYGCFYLSDGQPWCVIG